MDDVIQHFTVLSQMSQCDVDQPITKETCKLGRQEIVATSTEEKFHLVVYYSMKDKQIMFGYLRASLALNPSDSRTKFSSAYPSDSELKYLVDFIYEDDVDA